ARRQGDQQAAVRVVRGEEVALDGLLDACARLELELLPEATHAPLERELRGIPLGREAAQAEALDDVAAEQRILRVAGQLEDAAPTREHASLLIAHDEAGVRGRVVVVHQLEEEAEAAVMAGHRHVVELLEPVVVDGALLAVRADEERHPAAMLAAA